MAEKQLDLAWRGPAEPRGSRLQRLLALLEELRADGTRESVARFGREHGVSRRTLFRDLSTLRSSGINIEYDKKQGIYRTNGTAAFPLDTLSAVDIAAVLAALDSTAIRGGQSLLGQCAGSVRARIERFVCDLDEKLKEQIDELREKMESRATIAESAGLVQSGGCTEPQTMSGQKGARGTQERNLESIAPPAGAADDHRRSKTRARNRSNDSR